MLPSLAAELAAELRDLEGRGRLRECPAVVGAGRTRVEVGGRPLVSFCSNDYLGLAAEPELAAAASAAAARSGFGASAARLVSGDLPEHRSLEAGLAGLLGVPGVVLFPSGYQANIGVVTALAQRGDAILSDAENHASLIDGCRLSRAEILRYPHLDVNAVADLLQQTHGRFRRRLIVTESLFSMGGDVARLGELATLAERHGAALLVDEAHAFGVMGPGGRGLCAKAGVRPDALIATLGKALGAAGGLVAGCSELCRLLVNRARTFVFTTAMPPPVAAAAEAALRIVTSAEGDRRRAVLLDRIEQLRASLPTASDLTPIVPVILGPDRAAVAASSALRASGFFVQAIRPPTVPEGTARLRITLSAAHRPDDVAGLVAALRAILPR